MVATSPGLHTVSKTLRLARFFLFCSAIPASVNPLMLLLPMGAGRQCQVVGRGVRKGVLMEFDTTPHSYMLRSTVSSLQNSKRTPC